MGILPQTLVAPSPEVSECFRESRKRFGHVPSWLEALAHCPPLLLTTWDCWAPTMVAGCLPRKERALVAYAAARAIGCPTRQSHHAALLHDMGVTDRQIDELTDPERPMAGTERHSLALCSFAARLSLQPQACGAHDRRKLRGEGISHAEMLEAIAVVVWAGMLDRMTIAFGLAGPPTQKKGLRRRIRRRLGGGEPGPLPADYAAERDPGTIENWLRRMDRQRGGDGCLPPPIVPAASVPAAISALGPLSRRLCDGDQLAPARRWALAQDASFSRPGLMDADWQARWIFGGDEGHESDPPSGEIMNWLRRLLLSPEQVSTEEAEELMRSGYGAAELVESLYIYVGTGMLGIMRAGADQEAAPPSDLPGLQDYRRPREVR